MMAQRWRDEAMSTRTWRPSTSMPFILAIAAEARSGEEKVTKPKPLHV